MSKKIISLVLFFTIFSNNEIFGDSKTDSGYSKTGLFIEFGIPYHQISGDFDGQSWFKTKSITFKLPDAGDGIGWRLALGYSGTLIKKYRYSIDFNVAKSIHEMDWNENRPDASLTKYGFAGKFYQGGSKRWQPFFELGFFLTTLYLKHQAPFSELNPDKISQSKIIFTGFAGKCGPGVVYHLNRLLAVNFGIAYEIRSYYHVKISAATSPYDRGTSYGDRISGHGLMLNAGLRFSF